MTKTRLTLVALAVLLLLTSVVSAPRAQLALRARDPGPRGGPDAAGGPLQGLTRWQMASFEAGARTSSRRKAWVTASARAST